MGCEGEPLPRNIPKELSFEGFLRVSRSWSVVATAKEQVVSLLSEGVLREHEDSWGGSDLIGCIVYRAFLLAGKV